MTRSDGEKAAKLESDLQFVLADLNVPIVMQAKAFDLEYTSVQMFGVISDDRPTARQNISDVFEINPQEDGIGADTRRR